MRTLCSLRSLLRRQASYIFLLFRHFGRRCCKKGNIVAILAIFYASKHRFYSFAGPLGALRLGCGLRRWQLRAYCAEAAKKGARSLWMLRVRSLLCAIILASALTERVWSATPGLREKGSWAASLFTLARARRSLPSSDLNGHCLSRGAVSLATRGQKRACRARHPAAKQGGTAEFSRPWVSEKRPRTVFYCRVRAAGYGAPCRQERKIDESDR